MRASLQDVVRVINSKGVPDRITQEPFDYDPGHYRRLCTAQADNADASDLLNYALDMQYMQLQPDLLRHLTPLLLSAWRRDLFEGGKAGYAAFVEHFWPALLKGAALKTIFSERERAALIGYLRNTILDRLDAENSLRFSGMGASPYRWVESLVAYGVLFSDVESLWTEWWKTNTSGHAIAAFQYASTLLYESEKNPVFTAWTPDKGGGAPAVWECGCHIFEVGWVEANLSFLRRTLSVGYFKEHLGVAVDRISIEPARETALCILHEFPKQEALLALRIEELPKLLEDLSAVQRFTI